MPEILNVSDAAAVPANELVMLERSSGNGPRARQPTAFFRSVGVSRGPAAGGGLAVELWKDSISAKAGADPVRAGDLLPLNGDSYFALSSAAAGAAFRAAWAKPAAASAGNFASGVAVAPTMQTTPHSSAPPAGGRVTTMSTIAERVEQKVEQRLAAAGPGANRSDAAAAVFRDDPKLRAEYLAEMTPAGAKARAQAEWKANTGNCRSEFASEAIYVGYRVAELDGRVTATKRGDGRPDIMGSNTAAHAARTVGPMTREAAQQQAKDEWKNNTSGCRQQFGSEAAYVGYRASELRGAIGCRSGA